MTTGVVALMSRLWLMSFKGRALGRGHTTLTRERAWPVSAIQCAILVGVGAVVSSLFASSALAMSYRWVDNNRSPLFTEIPVRYLSSEAQPSSHGGQDSSLLIAQSPSVPSTSANPLQMPTGGWVGITLAESPITRDSTTGLLIADVLPNGPGDRAGLRSGDLLIKIGSVFIQEVLTEARAARVPGNTTVLAILRRLPPASRLPFQIQRGPDTLTVQVELGTPTADQTFLLAKRERASQQHQQIDVVEQWLAANVSATDLSRATASIGPLYREHNLLLRDIMNTAGESTLRAKLKDATQDRRLELLHKLIGVMQVVEVRGLPVCCGQADTYREFSRSIQGFLSPRNYFAKTLESSSPSTLSAIRSTLLFIEPYQDARERLQEVDSRLSAHNATVALNTEVATIQSQLRVNSERGARDADLDARIARLPDPIRSSVLDYGKQLAAGVEQRKRNAEAVEAERRKQKEAMDAGFEQLKASKQREDERRRLEREAAEARAREVLESGRRQEQQKDQERSRVLAKFRAGHVSSGDDLYDNPFKHQGQAVGVTDVRFKRMIEVGVAICETRSGKELLVSSIPVDSFSYAGESKSLVVKVVGTKPAKNAMGGPITLTHLEYVAILP